MACSTKLRILTQMLVMDRWPPEASIWCPSSTQILYIVFSLPFLNNLPPMKEFSIHLTTQLYTLRSLECISAVAICHPQGQQCLCCWRCHAWSYLGLRLLAEGCLHWWHGGGWGWLLEDPLDLDQFRGNLGVRFLGAWGRVYMVFGWVTPTKSDVNSQTHLEIPFLAQGATVFF